MKIYNLGKNLKVSNIKHPSINLFNKNTVPCHLYIGSYSIKCECAIDGKYIIFINESEMIRYINKNSYYFTLYEIHKWKKKVSRL